MKHYIDIPQTITYRDILEKDYNLSASNYKCLATERIKTTFIKKYENLLQDFYSLDGYAFSSNLFTSTPNHAIPLIQISNVNQSDFTLLTQFTRFIPKIHLREKFLLDKPCILLSLTGGENQDNISVFCEGIKSFYSIKEYLPIFIKPTILTFFICF